MNAQSRTLSGGGRSLSGAWVVAGPVVIGAREALQKTAWNGSLPQTIPRVEPEKLSMRRAQSSLISLPGSVSALLPPSATISTTWGLSGGTGRPMYPVSSRLCDLAYLSPSLPPSPDASYSSLGAPVSRKPSLTTSHSRGDIPALCCCGVYPTHCTAMTCLPVSSRRRDAAPCSPL